MVPMMRTFSGILKSVPSTERGMSLFPVLQKVHQLSEDAGQIGSVDLVYDQYANSFAFGLLAEFEERAGDDRVFQGAVRAGLGSDALDEVFVSVGRMELNQIHKAVTAADQVAGKVLGQEGFAGAGWAVDDGLAFAFEWLQAN